MKLKKYFVRNTTHYGPKIAHIILEAENGSQILLCNTQAIYKSGTLQSKELKDCLKECQSCVEASVKYVTKSLQGNRPTDMGGWLEAR